MCADLIESTHSTGKTDTVKERANDARSPRKPIEEVTQEEIRQ